ncbi:Trissin receptor [Holothuria leucospilota]|uniref:Trissin receptor n=1 Tax=Holothuria leucospilota TaxID=206669 RepID=A0A9Q1H557_HOLLE|nr:Trissin receptor [Holothuria leucospilota]
MENYTTSSDFSNTDEDPYTVSPVKEIIIVTYLSLLPVSLLGNFLVIYVIIKNKKLRTVTNFFLCNLAFADLLVAILCVIPKMMFFIMNSWPLGSTICALHNYVVSVTTKASIFTLTLISFERYFAILHPFRVRHLLTTTKLATATGILWASSLWLSAPVYFMYGTIPYNGVEFCSVVQSLTSGGRIAHDVVMMVICFFLPLFLMIIFYSKIIGKLWCGLNVMNMYSGFIQTQPARRVRFQPRFSFQTEITYNESSSTQVGRYGGNVVTLPQQNSEVTQPEQNNNYLNPGRLSSQDIEMSNLRRSSDLTEIGNSPVSGSPIGHFERHRRNNMYERNQTRKKVVRMLIAVVVTFIICMSPMQLYFFWDTIGNYPVGTTVGQMFIPFAYAMYFLNSCVNPIIYAVLSSNFRSKMKETLLCNVTHAQTSVYSPDYTRKRSISDSPTSV